MRGHKHLASLISVAAASLMLAVLVAAAAPSARAAFPGRNGRIVVEDNGGGTPGGVGGGEPKSGPAVPGPLVAFRPAGFDSPQDIQYIGAACRSAGFFYGLESGLPSCEPAYAPNGKTIVFSAGGRIGLIDADGRNERELPPLPKHTNPRAGYALEPTFSPDGRSLLLAWDGHLFTERLDGSRLRQIATGRLRGPGATSAAWSARELIAFVYRHNIFLIRSNGHGLRQLTYGGGADPAFSPRGGRIAFTRSVSSSDSVSYPYRIFIIGVDGRGIQPLRGISSGPSIFPAWSPDGNWIAFETGVGAGSAIIDTSIDEVRTNGRNLREVYSGGTYDVLGGPDWQPLPR